MLMRATLSAVQVLIVVDNQQTATVMLHVAIWGTAAMI